MRTVDLWEYLPLYLRKFEEMKALFASETPELQLLIDNCEKITDELFIQTATEIGLKRFEKMLGITPAKGDGPESRRIALMMRWTESIPYTLRTLRNRLEQLCGVDGFSIDLKNDIYTLNVIVALGAKNNFDDAVLMLKHTVPANMIINVTLKYNAWSTVKGTNWGQVKMKTWDKIKEEVLS